MIAKVIDPNKNWVFHFGSLVENEVPIKMKEKEGIVSFSVPLDESRVLKIEIDLSSYEEKKQIVEGKYTSNGNGVKETVIFKVREAGKLLQAAPKGSLSRFVWSISTKD